VVSRGEKKIGKDRVCEGTQGEENVKEKKIVRCDREKEKKKKGKGEQKKESAPLPSKTNQQKEEKEKCGSRMR